MPLRLDPRFTDADAAYRLLVDAHRGLSEADSAMLNTKLVLLLANHIGDLHVLNAALLHAKEGVSF